MPTLEGIRGNYRERNGVATIKAYILPHALII